MQTSRFYQYHYNTILFATQYKNDNTDFHRSSVASGGLVLLQAFCQWRKPIKSNIDSDEWVLDVTFVCYQPDCPQTKNACCRSTTQLN